MPTNRSEYPYKLKPIEVGLFTGMTDWVDPSATQKDRARLLYNMYLPIGGVNQPVVGRPGFGFIGSTSTVPLGASAKRTGQFIGQWTTLAGTTYTVFIVGGQGIYTYNWATDVVTQVVSVANLTTASITLSETARVFACVLADTMIFSDGLNTPWSWTGASGAGGLTKLTNCPVLYGQPAIYYSKLVGIKATEPNTIVWSEENDPTTGYEAGGFNNSWTPVSTGSERLYALAATNESIMLFRAQNISEVTGPTTDSFRTDGTRASVSEKEGTLSPSLLVHDDGIFFVNGNMQPHLAYPGGKTTEAYYECRETVKTVPRTQIAKVMILAYAPYDLVLVGIPKQGFDWIAQWLVYQVERGEKPNLVGIWSDWECSIAAVVNNGLGVPTLLHLGPEDGVLLMHGTPTGTVWEDTYAAADVQAIHHEVVAHPIGLDLDDEKVWGEATFMFRLPDDVQVDFSAETPNGIGTTLSFSAGGQGGTLFNSPEAVLDQFLFAGAGAVETRVLVGLDEFGRWLVPAWRHDNASERFGFIGARFNSQAVESFEGVL